MRDKLNIIFPFVILFSIIVLFCAILFFVLTRNYKEKRVKLYSTFLDMRFRGALLLSCTVLNFLLVLYFAFNISLYEDFCGYMIVSAAVISMIFAFDFKIIVLDALCAGVSFFAFKLAAAIHEYLSIFNEQVIMLLEILLIIAIVLFVAFISMKKIEFLSKKNKHIKRSEK